MEKIDFDWFFSSPPHSLKGELQELRKNIWWGRSGVPRKSWRELSSYPFLLPSRCSKEDGGTSPSRGSPGLTWEGFSKKKGGNQRTYIPGLRRNYSEAGCSFAMLELVSGFPGSFREKAWTNRPEGPFLEVTGPARHQHFLIADSAGSHKCKGWGWTKGKGELATPTPHTYSEQGLIQGDVDWGIHSWKSGS